MALLMVDRMSSVHLRCAFGEREAVRVVSRYPPGSESSCDIIAMGVWPTWMLAMRAWMAVPQLFLRLRDCRSFM